MSEWKSASTAPKGKRLLLATMLNGKKMVDIGGFDTSWTGQCWVWSDSRIRVGTEPYAWACIPEPPEPVE